MKKYIEDIKDISDIDALIVYLKQGILSGCKVDIIEDDEIEPETIIWIQERRLLIECCVHSRAIKYAFNEVDLMQIIESIDCAKKCCKAMDRSNLNK